MTNKDEQFTYEELTALCRKQEKYIKELEDKIYGTESEGKCCLQEPTYEELQNIIDRKVSDLRRSDEMLSAVMEALRISNQRLFEEAERAEYYKVQYNKLKRQEGK